MNVNYSLKILTPTHLTSPRSKFDSRYYIKKLSLPNIIARQFTIFCQGAHLKRKDRLKSVPNIIKWTLINTYDIFNRLYIWLLINNDLYAMRTIVHIDMLIIH